MKTILKFIKFTFFTTPRSALEWAQQNEQRLGTLTVVAMVIIVLLMLFGQLPTWTFIK